MWPHWWMCVEEEKKNASTDPDHRKFFSWINWMFSTYSAFVASLSKIYSVQRFCYKYRKILVILGIFEYNGTGCCTDEFNLFCFGHTKNRFWNESSRSSSPTVISMSCTLICGCDSYNISTFRYPSPLAQQDFINRFA